MVPLQAEFGIVLLVIGLLSLLLAIGGTYWVYRDASRRGSDNVVIWTLGTLIGWFVGGFILGPAVMILYYLIGRPDETSSAQQYGDVEEDWN